MSTLRPFDGRDRGQAFELRLGFDIDAEDAGHRPRARVRASVLPTPENMILSGGMPAASARFKFAFGDDIRAGAEPRQRRDHRLIGIRLHARSRRATAHRRRLRRRPGSGVPASPTNSNRTACRRIRESTETHRLGVEHAVAIGEVMHRGRSQSSRASSGMRFVRPADDGEPFVGCLRARRLPVCVGDGEPLRFRRGADCACAGGASSGPCGRRPTSASAATTPPQWQVAGPCWPDGRSRNTPPNRALPIADQREKRR